MISKTKHFIKKKENIHGKYSKYFSVYSIHSKIFYLNTYQYENY